MSVFSRYTKSSTEADVNINIDVNEGVKSPGTPEVPPPLVPPVKPETYSNPFEGQTVNAEPEDITGGDGTTEEVTEQIVTPPEDGIDETPGDSDNPFEEGESSDEDSVDETESGEEGDGESPEDEEPTEEEEKEETVEKAVESLESVRYTLDSIRGSGEAFDAGHAALAKLAIGLAVAPFGATASVVTPSLESDNYFEQVNIDNAIAGLDATIAAGKATIAKLKRK